MLQNRIYIYSIILSDDLIIISIIKKNKIKIYIDDKNEIYRY